MEGFDLFVDGRKYHVRRATLGKYFVTIPSGHFSADPLAHESTLFQTTRQATTKKNNPGDAAVVTRMKLREGLPPSLTPHQRFNLSRGMSRNDKNKVAAIVAGSREREAKARTEQLVRNVKKRQEDVPLPSPEPRTETDSIDGGLFEKIEYSKPADGWKDWRKRIRLTSMRD